MKEVQAQMGQDGFVVKFMQCWGLDIVRLQAPRPRRTSSCNTLLIVAGRRETGSFSPGPRARPKGYGPWKKVELATAVGNTAVETAWSGKVIGLAQHLLCRLLGLVLPRYAQVRQLGTVIASLSLVGRRIPLSVSLRGPNQLGEDQTCFAKGRLAVRWSMAFKPWR